MRFLLTICYELKENVANQLGAHLVNGYVGILMALYRSAEYGIFG